jgi:hypothetical protein
VFVTHGYTSELARFLVERGVDARPWRTQYEGEPEGLERQSAEAGGDGG